MGGNLGRIYENRLPAGGVILGCLWIFMATALCEGEIISM